MTAQNLQGYTVFSWLTEGRRPRCSAPRYPHLLPSIFHLGRSEGIGKRGLSTPVPTSGRFFASVCESSFPSWVFLQPPQAGYWLSGLDTSPYFKTSLALWTGQRASASAPGCSLTPQGGRPGDLPGTPPGAARQQSGSECHTWQWGTGLMEELSLFTQADSSQTDFRRLFQRTHRLQCQVRNSGGSNQLSKLSLTCSFPVLTLRPHSCSELPLQALLRQTQAHRCGSAPSQA